MVPGRLAPGQWGLETEAVEQADAADEAGASDGASQLIRSVRPTVREQHEEAAPGMSTASGVAGSDGAAAAPQSDLLLADFTHPRGIRCA